MDDRKWKIILIGLVVVSLLAAFYASGKRYALESRHREVNMAVVYDEAASLARMTGKSTVEVLRMYREKGVGAVLIKETTLEDGEQSGQYIIRTGRELLTLDEPGISRVLDDNFKQQIKPEYRYIIFFNEDTYQRVNGQLEAKKVRVKTWDQSGTFIIEVGYDWALLENIGLGFPAAAVQDVRDAGLQTLVQVRTWNQVTSEGLRYVFGEIGKLPGLSGIMFNDPVLPGVPDQIRSLSYIIKDLGVPVVQIEFSNQLGLSQLGMLLDKHVLRLHTLTVEEYAKKNYSEAEIVDRFTLAASERNISILLLHVYMRTDAPDMLQMNLQFTEKVRDGLVAEGLQVGQVSTLQPLDVSRPVLFIIGLGVIAGGMLLAFAMGLKNIVPYLGLLGLLLWTALLAVDMVNPARKLMAFIGVVVFPTLALTLNVKRSGSSVGHSVVLLLRTSLYSWVGALLMVGLLADVGFMLKLDQFTGVKLAHVAPLLLLAFIFFFRGNVHAESWQRQLKRFLEQPILVKFAVVGGILLIALLVYVSRTGNESVAISPLELKFRTLLDNLLGVRPRTKEFLLGHPLLLLLFYLGYRDNRYMPLLLGGAIGQISLVNTYAHIHTPLLISLVRSFNGLWLGIAGGLVLVALWNIGRRWVRRYWHEPN